MNKPIPYGRQSITNEDLLAVEESLMSDYLTQGPKIEEFEIAFAKYIGSKYAVAVSNGTTALHLCALALDVNSDTNVITSPITFAATANCIRYCDGNVYFADINPVNFILDIGKVEELILSKPEGFFKGIIPVDFAGYPVNLEEFKQIADKYNLWMIEDSCHSPGGYFYDKNNIKQNCGNGNFSDLSIFSFHPVKHIACGEGGMITTNNKKLYEKLILLRTHGITKNPTLLNENHGGWYYEMQELGYNYRLTDFQAALGLSQLNRASSGIERRKLIAKKYSEKFENKFYIKRQSGFILGHAYHLYIICVEKRKELFNYLKEKGINCQVHYIPMHYHPYYKKFGWVAGDFPISEKYYEECLSLPMYPTLSDEEQDYVIQTIEYFFEN